MWMLSLSFWNKSALVDYGGTCRGILVWLVICVNPGQWKLKILNMLKYLHIDSFSALQIIYDEEKMMGHLISPIGFSWSEFLKIWCPGMTNWKLYHRNGLKSPFSLFRTTFALPFDRFNLRMGEVWDNIVRDHLSCSLQSLNLVQLFVFIAVFSSLLLISRLAIYSSVTCGTYDVFSVNWKGPDRYYPL